MSLGKLVHWLGILVMLVVCFFDPIMGKEQNILAYKSYAGILFGFLLTILGIEVTRGNRKTCLLEVVADWLFEEEPEEKPSGEASCCQSEPQQAQSQEDGQV